jgi:hypothetical protein
MRLITFRVERNEPIGESSRNVDVSCKTVLRLRDLHLRSVSPLTLSRRFFGRTNSYGNNRFVDWKRSVTEQMGEESS